MRIGNLQLDEVIFTRLAIGISLLIHISLLMAQDGDLEAAFTRVGYVDVASLWDGAYWGLVAAAFIHHHFLHFGFNMYWMWVLGSRMERAVGTGWFILFFALSGAVASSYQVIASDTTGIGMSGVVYAIFGFMWFARFRYPSFSEILNRSLVNYFLAWMVFCTAATYFGALMIANAAHLTGLLFGVFVAGAVVRTWKRKRYFVGLVGLVAIAVTSLFWLPTSDSWQFYQANKELVAGHYEKANERYLKIALADAFNEPVKHNRKIALNNLGKIAEKSGRHQEAMEYFSEALKLDPKDEYFRAKLINNSLVLIKEAVDAVQLEKALEYCNQFIELSPNDHWGYRKRSTIYLALGQTEKSIADQEKAERLQFGNR